MKNTYVLKAIYTGNITSIEGYQKAIEDARPMYFEGLQSVFDYCGGKLFRQRHGWSGRRGSYDYICVKAPKQRKGEKA